MSQTKAEASTLKNATDAINQKQRHESQMKRKEKAAKQRIIWGTGILLTWLPVLISIILVFVMDETQEETISAINNFKAFIKEFFASGSFLWLSITLLATSLLELSLWGFKEKINRMKKIRHIKFLAFSLVAALIAVILYIINIGWPFKVSTIMFISLISFCFFAKASQIVSFSLVREV